MDQLNGTGQPLRAEDEPLRRVVEEAERAAGDGSDLSAMIIEGAPISVFVKDRGGRYLFINKKTERTMGWSREHVVGKTDHDILPQETADDYAAADRKVIETGEPQAREDTLVIGGQTTHWVTTKFALLDGEGKGFAACSMVMEITQLAHARMENERLQREIIRLQEESLRALSTPVLPIAEGVLVMPLVGAIDRSRAELVLSTLLSGITEHRARVVILDITGVPEVDGSTAATLVQAAQAVKLLGAEAVLTGVRPQIARTLVNLGVELTGIVLKSTLESGVAYALGRRAAPGRDR